MSTKRAIRIAGASGGFTDRQRAIVDLAQCPVDVIVGDWMSECTMSWHGAAKANVLTQGLPDDERPGLFDPSFMANLAPALPYLEQNGIKLAVNAGSSDTELLAKTVVAEVRRQRLSLKVAWVQGDEVLDVVNGLMEEGYPFENICFGGELKDWGFEAVAAQCYLGGAGIAEALKQGADIVVCGRVADAAPTIGAAMWWHGWDRDADFDAIAGSLVAGHLIECSSYVVGGYYSGFKRLFDGREDNLGFPIAAVYPDGSCTIEKEAGTGGAVNVGTVTSQLLYEIQGPQYFGSDVVAVLEDIQMTQEGPDVVRVTGVKGRPPPTTTRVGITAVGGYQAEFYFYFVGLDIEDKCEWTERQIRRSMGDSVSRFSRLEFQQIGSAAEDPRDQNRATVGFRVFAQSKDRSLMVKDTIDVPGFNRFCLENFLQSAPGATISNDVRTSAGKEFYEYWAALLPQSAVRHRVTLTWEEEEGGKQRVLDIPPSTAMQDYEVRQWSYETQNPVPLESFGPTTRGPLGWRVLGRSGDKASDANVGLFVEHDDEWEWIRSLLTVEKMKELLGAEYNGKAIDRFEIPKLRAVHFLLHDHLDRSFNASSTLDGLGKNVCEYIRAKHVDIPNRFLRRGRI